MFGTMPATLAGSGGGLPVTDGLQNWLDASTMAGVTFDGTAASGETIDTALDKSSASDAWQATWTGAETRPTWEDSEHSEHGTIKFTGTEMRLETAAILSGTQEGEIWAVINKHNANNVNSGLWQMGDIEDLSAVYHFFAGSNVMRNGWGSTAMKGFFAQDPAGVVEDVNFHLINVSSAASDWKMYINDVLQHSSVSNTVGWMTSDWVWGESVSNIRGMINLGESVIFNRILSAGERTSMRDYFNDKWSLGF